MNRVGRVVEWEVDEKQQIESEPEKSQKRMRKLISFHFRSGDTIYTIWMYQINEQIIFCGGHTFLTAAQPLTPGGGFTKLLVVAYTNLT